MMSTMSSKILNNLTWKLFTEVFEGKIYIIEANANPNIDRDDEVGQAAEKAGMTYAKFIQKIIYLALQRAES